MLVLALTDCMHGTHRSDVLCVGKAEATSYHSVKVCQYFTMASHVGGQNQINDSLHAEGMMRGEVGRGGEGGGRKGGKDQMRYMKKMDFKCSIKSN